MNLDKTKIDMLDLIYRLTDEIKNLKSILKQIIQYIPPEKSNLIMQCLDILKEDDDAS